MLKKLITPQDEIVSFNTNSIYKGHLKVTYKGVKAIRSPFDYIIYQMILFEVKPDLVIEIGTNIGGGALYIADLLQIIGNGVIHSIDIKKQYDPILESHDRIKLFMDGWENYSLDNTKGFKKILVIDDGSHQYESTLGAINKFASVVTPGSYLIVEDGIINKLGLKAEHNGGPLKAIREFLKKNKEFSVDKKWCNLFGRNATFNVNGYLKKRIE
jgi:cephalosporin hydroxylase